MTTKPLQNITIPISSISECSLDWQVKELIAKTNLEGKFGTMIPANEIPKQFQNIPIRDVLYLHGDVQVLTTKSYLKSVDEQKTLASLFQEEGLYVPFRRDYFQEV